MMEVLKDLLAIADKFDKHLLLAINRVHTPWLDECMIFLTEKFVWIPLYVVIVAMLVKKFRSKVWLPLIVVALIITASDQFASGLMKPWIGRLRPCHVPELQSQLHLVKGCGGTYGFISSHAANTFALATFLTLVFSLRWFSAGLFLWCSAVSYSRIYLGAHYPGDIVFGAISGMIISYLFFQLFYYLNQKFYYNNTIRS